MPSLFKRLVTTIVGLATTILVACPAYAYIDDRATATVKSVVFGSLIEATVAAKKIPILPGGAIANVPIDRMDAARLLAWLAGYQDGTRPAQCRFIDVPSKYAPYVEFLAESGVMLGVGEEQAGTGPLSASSLISMLGRILSIPTEQLSNMLPKAIPEYLTQGDLYLIILSVLFHPYTMARVPLNCGVDRTAMVQMPETITIDVSTEAQARLDMEMACWFLPSVVKFRETKKSTEDEVLSLYLYFADLYAAKRGYVYRNEMLFEGPIGDVYGQFVPALSVDETTPFWRSAVVDVGVAESAYQAGSLSTYDFVFRSYRLYLASPKSPASFTLKCRYADSWTALVALRDDCAVYGDQGMEAALAALWERAKGASGPASVSAEAISALICQEAEYHSGAVTGTVTDDSHRIAGFLTDGRVVCDGYSNTFKFLMNLMGHECVVVYGQGPTGAHAWNKVKIDGVWYNIDVTWSDSDGDDSKYFLKSDDFFRDTGHSAKSYHSGPYFSERNF